MLRLSTLALFATIALAGSAQAQKFLSVNGENTRMTIGAMATAAEEAAAAAAETDIVDEGEDVAVVVEDDEEEYLLIPEDGDFEPEGDLDL